MKLTSKNTTEIFIPILSLIIKSYEFAIKENQQAYSNIIHHIDKALLEGMKKNCCAEDLLKAQIKITQSSHRIEPFLSKNERKILQNHIQTIRDTLTNVFELKGQMNKKMKKQVTNYFQEKREIRDFLLLTLFEENPVLFK